MLNTIASFGSTEWLDLGEADTGSQQQTDSAHTARQADLARDICPHADGSDTSSEQQEQGGRGR